jgi:hypothetical protein
VQSWNFHLILIERKVYLIFTSHGGPRGATLQRLRRWSFVIGRWSIFPTLTARIGVTFNSR